MSRETKAGLVIIASFLSLAAGVFIVKYSDFGHRPATETEQQQAAASNEMESPSIPAPPATKVPEPQPAIKAPAGSDIVALTPLTPPPIKDNENETMNDVVGANSPTKALAPPPAEVKPVGFETPAVTVPLPDAPPASAPNPDEKSTDSSPPLLEIPSGDAKKDVPPPKLELPGADDTKDKPAPKIELPGNDAAKVKPAPKIELPGSDAAKNNDASTTIVLPGSDAKKNETAKSNASGSNEKKADVPLIELPGEEPKKASGPPTIAIPDTGAKKSKPASGAPNLSLPEPPPALPSKTKNDEPKLIELPGAANANEPKTIDLPGIEKNPRASAAPKMIELPGKSTNPDLPPDPPRVSTPDPWKSADAPKVSAPGTAKAADPVKVTVPAKSANPTNVPVPDSSNPGAPAVRLNLPTNNGADSADLPARAAPDHGAPRVDSYDEEWYSCRAGDTLERISKRFFNSEKYAQALRLHNLDRDGRDLWRDEQPLLQAGDVVKVPPARILERNHPAAIPGMKAPAGRSNMSGTPAGNGRDYAQLTSVRSAFPDAAPPYEVQRDGMTFRDVASQTLGSSDKWMMIFRLNRGFNPEMTLPKGALLRLPSDARLP